MAPPRRPQVGIIRWGADATKAKEDAKKRATRVAPILNPAIACRLLEPEYSSSKDLLLVGQDAYAAVHGILFRTYSAFFDRAITYLPRAATGSTQQGDASKINPGGPSPHIAQSAPVMNPTQGSDAESSQSAGSFTFGAAETNYTIQSDELPTPELRSMPRINLYGMNQPTLDMLVQFVYTGELTFNSNQPMSEVDAILQSLKRAADMYLMPGLERAIEEFENNLTNLNGLVTSYSNALSNESGVQTRSMFRRAQTGMADATEAMDVLNSPPRSRDRSVSLTTNHGSHGSPSRSGRSASAPGNLSPHADNERRRHQQDPPANEAPPAAAENRPRGRLWSRIRWNSRAE